MGRRELVRFVLVYRLSARDWLSRLGRGRDNGMPTDADLLRFVYVLENIGDHRRGYRAAMHIDANFALVNCRESELRLVGRQEPGEPRRDCAPYVSVPIARCRFFLRLRHCPGLPGELCRAIRLQLGS